MSDNSPAMKLIVDQSAGQYYVNGGKLYKPGDYRVTVKGAIPGVTETASTAKTTTYTFTLTDPCDPPTSITFSATSDFNYKITATEENRAIPTFTITPNYCLFDVTRDIGTLSNPHQAVSSPTSYDQVNTRYTTSYGLNLDILGATQTITTTATPRSVHQINTNNQVGATVSDSYTITYVTPCDDPTLAAITVPTQTATTDNSYTGDATWTYTPVTVLGGLCPITLTCESVSGPASVGGFECPCGTTGCTQAVHEAGGTLTSGSFTITRTYDSTAYGAEGNTKTPPGDYTYNLKVSTGGAGAELNKDIVVVQKVLDPCLKTKGITINDVTMNT